jgi:hypothetical protein
MVSIMAAYEAGYVLHGLRLVLYILGNLDDKLNIESLPELFEVWIRDIPANAEEFAKKLLYERRYRHT